MRVAFVYADRLDFEGLYAFQTDRVELMGAMMTARGWDVTPFTRIELPEHLDGFDLVVAAGGDGTQLDAAMRIKSTPLCAVRLFPKKSVGFLCSFDFDRFDTFLDQFEAGVSPLTEVARLQIFIDGQAVQTPVLNDILLAHKCPARASRYVIEFGEVVQSQCSSGIWVATQPGSYGGARSAGAQPLTDPDRAVFCVRECPKPGTLKSDSFLPGRDHFMLSAAGSDLILFLDGGLTQIPLENGQAITFGRHPYSLLKYGLKESLV